MRKDLLRLTSILSITLSALSGCGMVTANLVPSEAVKTSPDDTIIFIGVKQSYVIGIHKGTYEGEAWRQDYIAPYSSKTSADSGYIAVRLPPRVGQDSYGVSAVIDGATIFRPCTGMSTLTFEAPPSKAIYVGDVEFVRSGTQLSLRFSQDEGRARRYIEDKFPSLAASIATTQAKVTKTVGVECGSNTTIIPIYIGR